MVNHIRLVGVEIEVAGLWGGDLAVALRNGGVPAQFRDYTHDYTEEWKVVRDGSVSDGCEVVSPPMPRKPMFEALKQVCTIITGAGGTVDRRCGFHVHHSVGDFTSMDLWRLALLTIHYEHVVDGLLAPSRRDNRYCVRMHHPQSLWYPPIRRDRRWVEFLRWYVFLQNRRTIPRNGWSDDYLPHYDFDDLDRYQKVNFRSLGSYGTVEFRQHQGTLNARKMAMWIDLTQRLIERARHPLTFGIRHNTAPASLEGMFEQLSIPVQSPQARYWRERQEELSAG